jgi:integrase
MRQPRPFYRKFTKSWFVQLDGKFHPLGGKGKDTKTPPQEVLEKYNTLMVDRKPATSATTVDELIGRFLTWCKEHRDEVTHSWYTRHLKTFRAHVGPKLKVSALKMYHVTEWLDARYRGRGNNYRHGACRTVSRAFNWSVKQGLIETSPVRGMEKPQPNARVAYLTPAEWETIIGKVKDSQFLDALRFLRASGCRPQEMRAIEARHFDWINEQIVFPVKESKGKRDSRVIPLNSEALAMVTRLAMKYPEGKLFRNVKGRAWTKSAIGCRFTRLRKKLKIKDCFAYAVRHTYATDALQRGVDPVTLAIIMGHKDATMIIKVYGHTQMIAGHVRAAVALATGEATVGKAVTA